MEAHKVEHFPVTVFHLYALNLSESSYKIWPFSLQAAFRETDEM